MMANPTVSVADARALLEGGATVVDVRELDEWRLGRIEGSIHIPLGDIPDRASELPAGQLICVCRSGSRSLVATRFLNQEGHEAVNLDGGLLAWFLDGEPLVADHDHPSVA